MRNLYIKFFVILFLVCISTPSLAYTDETTGGQLEAKVIPNNPGPFTTTYISLKSYEVNLNKSYISWIVNGQQQQGGVGKTSINLITADVGKKIVINATVNSPDGKTLNKTISLLPASVDILWQSDGYVPPFYKGKALVSNLNKIKIVAIPNIINEGGSKITTADISYEWRLNTDTTKTQYGNNIIELPLTEGENRIAISASTLDGQITAHRSISITPFLRDPIIYKESPLFGVEYTKALPLMYNVNQQEISIQLEPYYYPKKTVDLKTLPLGWYLNGNPISGRYNKITLRTQPKTNGNSLLTAIINEKTNFSRQYNIIFNFGNTSQKF